MGFRQHLTATTNTSVKEKTQGEQAPRKLLRFRHLSVDIKIHLVKLMVLPTLDYPPIPKHTKQHTDTKTTENTKQITTVDHKTEIPLYTHTTRQIHELTHTETINIRLYKQTFKIWETLHQQEKETYQVLQEKSKH